MKNQKVGNKCYIKENTDTRERKPSPKCQTNGIENKLRHQLQRLKS